MVRRGKVVMKEKEGDTKRGYEELWRNLERRKEEEEIVLIRA